MEAPLVDLRDLGIDAQTHAPVGEIVAKTGTLRQRVEGYGVAMLGKLRAISIPQSRGSHLNLDLLPYNMAHQQRLEKRTRREACQLRDHKVQHVGKSECLQRVERTAACQPAQPSQLIPSCRDGSGPNDERGRFHSVAWKCRLRLHGPTTALHLLAEGTRGLCCEGGVS